MKGVIVALTLHAIEGHALKLLVDEVEQLIACILIGVTHSLQQLLDFFVQLVAHVLFPCR